jgi:hypothetical protein
MIDCVTMHLRLLKDGAFDSDNKVLCRMGQLGRVASSFLGQKKGET